MTRAVLSPSVGRNERDVRYLMFTTRSLNGGTVIPIWESVSFIMLVYLCCFVSSSPPVNVDIVHRNALLTTLTFAYPHSPTMNYIFIL